MTLKIEGFNDAVPNTGWTTLSSNSEKRCLFIQARSNIFLRVATDTTNNLVILGEITGSVVDIGVIAPVNIEVQAITGTAAVSMYSLDPGERR
jgi:hypothetical protein